MKNKDQDMNPILSLQVTKVEKRRSWIKILN